MPRLLYGNFDFDDRLARPELLTTLPKALQAINRDLAAAWWAVAEAGDVIWSPVSWTPQQVESFRELLRVDAHVASLSRQVPAGLSLEPWGCDVWSARHAMRCGLSGSVEVRRDEWAVVAEINSRRFAHEQETLLTPQVGRLSVLCDSEDDVVSALTMLTRPVRPWLMKANRGGSGRQTWRGQGADLSPQFMAWCSKRWRRGVPLFFEPCLDRIEEAGLQWTIPAEGPPTMDGVVPLLVDEHGQYRGSLIADASNATLKTELARRWEFAVDVQRRVCERMQRMGYHGPVGIDAMRYRDGNGVERVRPLQDINARWTMGRIALGWRRLLQPGEFGTWLHGHHSQNHDESALPDDARVIRTSPTHIGEEPVARETRLIITREPHS